jgi:hypothetical protein
MDAFEHFLLNEKDSRIMKKRKTDTTSEAKSTIRLLKICDPTGQKRSLKNNEYCKTSDSGEFIVSLSDFIELFDELFIVHQDFNMLNSNLKECKTKFQWNSIIFEGHWIKNLNSGGFTYI